MIMSAMNAIAVLLLALAIGYNCFPAYVSKHPVIHSTHLNIIPIYVLNCFPNTNITAFVTFEQDRVSRLRYEGYSAINATLQPNSDFLIQFREAVTDIVYHNFTDYGFMAPRLHSNMEMLLVIGRDTQDSNKPKHHLHAFDQTEVESMSSRLFVFNAMWNKEYPDKGINVYGLYQRSNTDGSESESVTRLVDNLGINEGREISLEPNKQIHIKVTYKNIGSVLEFKETQVFIEKEEFTAAPGVRHYLVVYGDYAVNSKARPALKILSKMGSGSSVIQSTPLLTSIIIIFSLTICSTF